MKSVLMKTDKSKIVRKKCACETRWLVDFMDKRGEQPTTPLVAGVASGIGLKVRSASISSRPLRPISPLVGVEYGYGNPIVAARCAVCGYATEIEYPSKAVKS
jgi:hypothetical protein